MQTTSATLLHRLRQPDAETAWHDFVHKYSPLILRYARRCGLQNDEAKDCLQQSLMALLRLLPGFYYDAGAGKFRTYLFRVVRHQTLAMMRRRMRQGLVAPDRDLAESLSLVGGIEPEAATWQQALLDEAWARLCSSGRLEPATMGAFEDYVFKSEDAGQVARKHGMKTNTLYQIRSRVIAMLKEEVGAIEEQLQGVVWT